MKIIYSKNVKMRLISDRKSPFLHVISNQFESIGDKTSISRQFSYYDLPTHFKIDFYLVFFF